MTESFTFFLIGRFISKIFWLSNLCCIICLCDHSKKKKHLCFACLHACNSKY